MGNGGLSGDSFFGVVRRRHPDVDIIVLPPEVSDERALPPVDPAALGTVPAQFDTELADLWSSIAVGIDRPELTAHWSYGAISGSVTREALVVVDDADGVDGVTAHGALARAERFLNDSGWHTLVPSDGIPRVLASRDDEYISRQLQVIYVPGTSRIAMTYAAGPYFVGEAAARAAVKERP